MSRQFDGVDDVIGFTAGGLASLDGGPISIAFLYNPTAVKAGGLIWTRNAGAAEVWEVNPYVDGNIYIASGGGNRFTTYTDAQGWGILVFTKANGTSTPRVHKYFYDSPGWSHADLAGTLPDAVNGPITQWQVGRYSVVNEYYQGLIGVVAAWDVELSDGQVATMHPSLGAWMNLSPVMCCPMNQASTATAVTDITGNGADQTSITGTSVSASEPDGWTYNLVNTVTGTGVANLGALTGAASGATQESGTGAADLGGLTGTASGTVASAGSGTSNLGALTATADGDRTTFGSGVSDLDRLRASFSSEPIDIILEPLMQTALQCLCEAAANLPNPPQHCCFRVGFEVAHDAGVSQDLCCEGLAYVSLGDIYPSSGSFPEADIVRQAQANCPPPTWGVQIKMGIIRCIPVGGLEPLDCDSWNDAALQNIYDSLALRRASCCLRDYVVNNNGNLFGMSLVIERQTQTSPLGGCVERSVTISAQIPNCNC